MHFGTASMQRIAWFYTDIFRANDISYAILEPSFNCTKFNIALYKTKSVSVSTAQSLN